MDIKVLEKKQKADEVWFFLSVFPKSKSDAAQTLGDGLLDQYATL